MPFDLRIDTAQILVNKNNQPQWLNEQSLIIDKGLIKAIRPTSEVPSSESFRKVVQLKKHRIFPSLQNHFCSLGATLLQPYGQGLPNALRLQNHLMPLEQRFLSEELIEASALIATILLYRHGTTTAFDVFWQPNVSAQIFEKSPLDLNIGIPLTSKSHVSNHSSQDLLAAGLRLIDQYKHSKNIRFSFFIEQLETYDRVFLSKLSGIINELGLPLVVQGLADSKTFKQLLSAGLISPELVLVNPRSLLRREQELLVKAGVKFILTPTALAKQGVKAINYQDLSSINANIGLGTDNLSSANFSLLHELNFLSLQTKYSSGSASQLNSTQLLELAFKNSMNGQVGLNEDQHATFCVQPISKESELVSHDPFEQMVYTAPQTTISHLWINGDCKLNDHQLTDIDESLIQKSLQQWQTKFNEASSRR